ncbi:MAG: hypothetical protein KA717_20330 [Woronichinia naegeliana WA131]|jgi:mRNA-degrading endonuclease YafQ of YafQ-DinJ toxin-antitoxin module|uniref:Type II toxin-antitoxin system mRNA interferase toxin, RelE/StbE family n=1 Tax=Woronichinia naegeliana WA131 TaxID=2824559 RepID=A0A977KRS4_9CYAN|nr:MAG: hypothetical protein KA717_20330 [Woronichinia naegeliana WA131]
MIEISFDDSFKRAFKKRFQGNHELERKFRTKLEKFKENPFDPSLKTHKLSGKLKELDSGKFSSRVSEKRKSDMRYPRVPLCPKLADIENR